MSILVYLSNFSAPSTPKNLSLKYSNLGKNWAGKNEGRRRRSVNKIFGALFFQKNGTFYERWSKTPIAIRRKTCHSNIVIWVKTGRAKMKGGG